MAAASLLLCAPRVFGQAPQLSEMIEVRVVNVDVVVTDADGTPIAGLEPEDFELRVDGKPVEIKYFSSIRDGSPLFPDAAAGDDDAAGDPSELEYKPYLAILLDGRALDSASARDAVSALRERIPQLVESSRGVMVVRHGRQLSLGQSFTRNPDLLARALDAAEEKRVRAVDSPGTDMLLRRLERMMPASNTPSAEDPNGTLTAEAEAISFLNEIRAEVQTLHFQTSSAMRDLKRFVSSLAGLPGRKSVLYFGPGFNTRPGEILYRLWWSKYAAIAHLVGMDSVEPEIARYRIDEDMVRLIQHANENRVSFYTFDPGGQRSSESLAMYSSMQASDLAGTEVGWKQNALVSLASGTGGIGRVDMGRPDYLVNRMVGDFRTYYSLGFEPDEDTPDRGRIRVKVKWPQYDVRHLEYFATRDPKRLLEENTLAALLTDEGRNPLQFGVELEDAEKQKDGSVLMPIVLKIPISRVTLLPDEKRHVGRLQVVVIAQAESGDLSPPAHGEMPIEIDNGELLEAMNRLAGYRMRLRMRDGEQRIAIGIRDEITGEDSTLNLVVDAGGP